MPTPRLLSLFIKSKASEIGFDACGIAEAGRLSEDERHFSSWLEQGFNGSMGYMANHFEKRINIASLVEGAKSVIVLALNYNPAQILPENSAYLVSRYAYGNDYHEVIHEKLKLLMSEIREFTGTAVLRGFVDSAPVLEKRWAVKAGIGWIGKNSLLILPKRGSYYFLAEIVTDLELKYNPPFVKNHCGTCTRCITACPVKAISEDGTLKANRCISYLTIENKGVMPSEFKGSYHQWIFGCDICQQVCPWNTFAVPHNHQELSPREELFEMSKSDWENLDDVKFKELFRNSALKRAKLANLRRNIDFLNAPEPSK